MTSMDRIIDRICAQVLNDLGDGTTDAKLKSFEETINEQVRVASKRARFPKRRLAMIAAAFVLSALPGIFIVLELTKEVSVPFWMGKDRTHGGFVGVPLTTVENDIKVIHFEHGSGITLMGGTVAAVEHATDERVTITLDRGELFLSVEGKESETWAVDVGNHRVTVLGTQFYVSRPDNGQLLDVRVKKGTVLVEGPSAGEAGIAVSKDKHFRLDVETGFVAMSSMSSEHYDPSSPSLVRNDDVVDPDGHAGYEEGQSSAIPSGDIETKAIAGDSPEPREVEHGKSQKAFRKTARRLSWVRYLEQGKPQEAVNAAEAVGFLSVVESATLKQLWKLMKIARTLGREDMAEIALLTCRQRFGQSSNSRLAAFILGKISYVEKNDLKAAAKWFRTYLDEAPSGALAEEAMGRLILISKEQGKRDQAKTLALQYLTIYPSGPFSNPCRALVGE